MATVTAKMNGTTRKYPCLLNIKKGRMVPLNYRNYELWSTRLREALSSKFEGALDIMTGKIPIGSPDYCALTDLELLVVINRFCKDYELTKIHAISKKLGNEKSGGLVYRELERKHIQQKAIEKRLDISMGCQEDIRQLVGEDIRDYIKRASALFLEADESGMVEVDEADLSEMTEYDVEAHPERLMGKKVKRDWLGHFNTASERMKLFFDAMTPEYKKIAQDLQSKAEGRLDRDWRKLADALEVWKGQTTPNIEAAHISASRRAVKREHDADMQQLPRPVNPLHEIRSMQPNTARPPPAPFSIVQRPFDPTAGSIYTTPESLLRVCDSHIPPLASHDDWEEWDGRMQNLLRPFAKVVEILTGELEEGNFRYDVQTDIALLAIIDRKVGSPMYDTITSLQRRGNCKGSVAYKALKDECARPRD